MKQTRIKMTPMWHWLLWRIEAHVKICVVALLLERVAEHVCGRPWPRIRKDLKRLQATVFETGRFRFLQHNELPGAASSTLKALAVPVPNEVLALSLRE